MTLNGNKRLISQMRSKDFLKFIIRFNKTKIAIATVQRKTRKTENFVNAKVFDLNLELQWESTLKYSFPEQKSKFVNLVFDNNDNFHLHLHYSIKTKGIQARILSFYDKGKEMIIHELKANDKIYTRMNLSYYKPRNELILAGYYSYKSRTSIRGIMHMRIDITNKVIINQNTQALDNKLLLEMMPSSRAEYFKKDENGNITKELNDYRLWGFVHKEDGGVWIIGEQYETHSIQKRGKSYTRYSYGDIFVINVNQKGEFVWANSISKNQDRIYSPYKSFRILSNNTDRIYFLFNERTKKIKSTNDSASNPQNDFRKLKPMIVTLQMHNNKSKEILYQEAASDMLMMPNSLYKIDNSQFFIILGNDKKDQLARITIKDN